MRPNRHLLLLQTSECRAVFPCEGGRCRRRECGCQQLSRALRSFPEGARGSLARTARATGRDVICLRTAVSQTELQFRGNRSRLNSNRVLSETRLSFLRALARFFRKLRDDASGTSASGSRSGTSRADPEWPTQSWQAPEVSPRMRS